MGFLSTSAIVIIQDSVDWAERGAATASNIFSRNLGSTLGATVLGAVLNFSLTHGSAEVGPADAEQIRQLLEHPGAAVAEATVRAALGHALHLTFWAVFAIAALTFLSAILVPKVSLERARGKPSAA